MGGGGGSNYLFPIETHITCDFPGGVRTPCPPPSGSALDFVSVALFSQIQSVGIVDGQEGGLFGASPDCITVSTATTIFEDSSTNLVSNAGVPVELIPSSISVDGSIQEIVTETIQPVTPEKVLQILQGAPFHFFLLWYK